LNAAPGVSSPELTGNSAPLFRCADCCEFWITECELSLSRELPRVDVFGLFMPTPFGCKLLPDSCGSVLD
jgi:hypothetical protein